MISSIDLFKLKSLCDNSEVDISEFISYVKRYIEDGGRANDFVKEHPEYDMSVKNVKKIAKLNDEEIAEIQNEANEMLKDIGGVKVVHIGGSKK